MKQYVRYGASPRAAQALVLAGKIHALTRGHAFVSVEDIRAVALPALRHRMLLNFEGEAEQVNTDAIVARAAAACRPTGVHAERVMPLRFEDDFLKKLEYLHVVSKRAFAGQNRADRLARKRGRGLEFADHRAVRAGRRLPPHRLEGLQAAEPAAAPPVRRGAGPADLPVPRRQPLDGRAGEVRPGAAHRRGALLHRSRASRSRRRSCRSAARLGDEIGAGRGKGRIFRVFELLEQMDARGTDRSARVVQAVCRAPIASRGSPW